MVLISIIQLIFTTLYKTVLVIEIIQKNLKKKTYIKKICLFIIFYIFFNLYLFPTIALCEIDLDLLDRENNTYKNSKIVYETENEIVTEKELKEAQQFCRKVSKISFFTLLIILNVYLQFFV